MHLMVESMEKVPWNIILKMLPYRGFLTFMNAG